MRRALAYGLTAAVWIVSVVLLVQREIAPALTLRIESPEDERTPEDPNVPDPEDKLVRDLKGNSRKLLKYLWKRGNVSRGELRREIWGGDATDKAINLAIDYLNRGLNKLGHTKTLVESSGDLYYLRHPAK